MGKFYITTPIYYVNAEPHLGHAYTGIAADVLARWHREQGDQTFFLTGTDEHGVKNVRSAQAVGKTTEEFVKIQREKFQALYHTIGISNDAFIYTADQEKHWPGVIKLWQKLTEAGDLYKDIYKGMYCVGHEAFITEKDLVNGVCPDHNQKPEVIEEENYFFQLSKYAGRIRELIEKDEFVIAPVARKNEVLSFLKNDIADISFSRPSKDIPWGVPVPGDPEHTVYVWADALPNYLSALGYGSSDETAFQKFWPADIHLIGKDILRFHAVIWPAMLLSVGLPLPKKLFVHGMILSDGKKMSKTIGNVIHPDEIISEYGVEAFRYFLMREIPFGEDGDFTKTRFSEVYEGNLAHGLGNLVSRTSAMITKSFNGTLTRPSEDALVLVPTKRVLHHEVSAKKVFLEGENLSSYFVREVAVEFDRAMKEHRLTEALTIVSQFYGLLDGYIQDYEPYKLVKLNQEQAGHVLWNVAWHLVRSSALLAPFMPETAKHICDIFGVSTGERENPAFIKISASSALFPSKKKHEQKP